MRIIVYFHLTSIMINIYSRSQKMLFDNNNLLFLLIQDIKIHILFSLNPPSIIIIYVIPGNRNRLQQHKALFTVGMAAFIRFSALGQLNGILAAALASLSTGCHCHGLSTFDYPLTRRKICILSCYDYVARHTVLRQHRTASVAIVISTNTPSI